MILVSLHLLCLPLLNRNIGCIEIFIAFCNAFSLLALNRNIGCIEIMFERPIQRFIRS